MKKRIISRAGSEAQYGPRLAGEILHDYLENSNEPLAVAYRNRLFKDVFPNTEVSVNLKLLTRKPGRLPVGTRLDGVINRISEDNFIFVQNYSDKKIVSARNPHLYRGSCINVVKRCDGMLVPTFCTPHYSPEFTFKDFCREAAKELLMLTGLVENT